MVSPCDLLINVTLNLGIINVSFAAAFLIKSFHTNNFSGLQPANAWWALFCCLLNVTSIFSLNLLGTGLLYIMMNSSFMSVHHLVCHLDLNEMETHKVATLSLPWLYQITLSASFGGRLKFWRSSKVLKQLSFWSSSSP